MSGMEAIKKLTAPTARKAALSTGRGSISNVKDSGKIQTVQFTAFEDEVRDKVERIQEYGFTSNPPSGSDVAVIFIGGVRDHGLAIATDSREFRKKDLQPGEVCIYDKNGKEIYLQDTEGILIKASDNCDILVKNNEIIFTVDGVETKFDQNGIKTDADVEDSEGTMQEIRDKINELVDVFNAHNHGTTSLPPSPTAPPNTQQQGF